MAASNEYGEYIDYESFLPPDFSPAAFANTLVLATNNPSDIPLDLSTPLSRVLFDTQEIDSHIDHLTTKSAVPLLSHTRSQTTTSTRIVAELETQIESLNGSFKQLEKEVLQKHAEADHVRRVVSRLWLALRLGRSVNRCLQLGRQLEIQLAEAYPPSSAGASKLEDHRVLIRCAHTINSISEILEKKGQEEEGYGLDRIMVIQTLRDRVLSPGRLSTREASETIIRNFISSPSNASGGLADPEGARSRVVSAITVLYLLSPPSTNKGRWVPILLQQGIEVNLRASLQASISTLARALGQLPQLDRALSEVSSRCRIIVVLEHILRTTKVPSHPSVTQLPQKQGQDKDDSNLLPFILEYLETGSLVSHFWRSLASSLSSRVQELVNRGGVAARTLRTNKSAISDALRNCVIEGSRADIQAKNATSVGNEGKHDGWEREIAVMTSSVVGSLGR